MKVFKKFLSLCLVLMMVLVVTACGGAVSSAPAVSAPVGSSLAGSTSATGGDFDYSTLSICLLIHGNLGDNGYFDSAAAGAYRLRDELGVEINVVEMGLEKSLYEVNLMDVSEMDYDVVIMGGFDYSSTIMAVAEQYPDQKYIMYDNIGDFEGYDIPNVYAYTFAANEGSFLGGALAAHLTVDTENMEYSDPEAVIGVLCSADDPMLNNFVCGYIQGAAYVNEDIKVLSAYVGTAQDSVTAKELALQMYAQGADYIYAPAGQTIMAIIEAAVEANGYVIGCDSDQSTLIESSYPEGSKATITSAVKEVGNSIFDNVVRYAEGTLPFGTGEALGLNERVVGLSDNANYTALVTQDIRDKVEAIRQDIIDGKIEVMVASDMDAADVTAYRTSFQP